MPHNGLQIVELRKLDLPALEPLLAEETAEWEQELDWDFTQNAEQVRRFISARCLPGIALVDRGQVVGYGYSILEEPKGLIGDVYLRPGWRGAHSEMQLFKVILDALSGSPEVTRVESQLMLVPPHQARVLQGDRFVRLFERRLLTRETGETSGCAPETDLTRQFRFDSWDASLRERLAPFIVRTYEGHVDGQINDQFTSTQGASAFLRSLLDNSGCGELFRPASMFAIDRQTGLIAGAVLTSFVARDTGHIVQLCVAPEAQGLGLGRELLCRAVRATAEGGAQRISLTVTSANTKALRLYDRFGFREQRRFCAFVWDAQKRMSNSI